MSVTTVQDNNSNHPVYYHRDWENDLKHLKPESSTLQQAQRVTLIAMSFLSLYKPLGSTISAVMNLFSKFFLFSSNVSVKSAHVDLNY